MPETGWTGEGPDGGPTVTGGFAEFIGSMRGGPEDKPDALARARMAPEPRDPEPRDPDEVAAGLMARGYAAGHVSDLGQRLADKRAELAGELAKIERGEKVTARVRGMLERGQIGGLEAARMMDGDFGDVHRAEQLQRQCANLQRQIGDAQALIGPAAERAPDQFASANRTARELFAATTRERLAAAQAGKPQRARRPKEVSRSRGDAIRSEHCFYCTKEGLDDDTSYLIHSDPDYDLPVTTAEQAAVAAQYEQDQAAGRSAYQPGAVITTGYREIAR